MVMIDRIIFCFQRNASLFPVLFFSVIVHIFFFRDMGFNRIKKLPRRIFANLMTLQQL